MAPATELGSPYIKYKGSLVHFWLHLDNKCRYAVKIDHDQWARLNKSAASANGGCIPGADPFRVPRRRPFACSWGRQQEPGRSGRGGEGQ